MIANRVDRIDSIFQIAGSFLLHNAGLGSGAGVVYPYNQFEVEDPVLDGSLLQVVIEFQFSADVQPTEGKSGDGKDETRERLFEASGRFAVQYVLAGDEEPSAADMLAFAHINGPLNLVPYWREALASSLSRAGMPSYAVPVFNPVKLAMEMAQSDADSSTATDNDPS